MKPNRYPLPLRQRIHLRFGGLWNKSYPDMPTFGEMVQVVAFVLVLLIVQALLDHKAHAIERAEERAEQAERTVVECLNGIAIWKAADGSEVGCMPAETNNTERTKA